MRKIRASYPMGRGSRLYDEIAARMADHQNVEPAVVDLTVGELFVSHYQLSYGDDFIHAVHATFELVVNDLDEPPSNPS